MVNFVVVDSSTLIGNSAQYGGPISPAQLSSICAALEIQANRDFSGIWPTSGVSVRAASGPADVQPGEIVATLVDSLDVPGAVAYHDINMAVPYILLARTTCSNISSGSSCVSAGLSHEIMELLSDIPCNRWADAGNGYEFALEMCDAVQNNSYVINGVWVSDFVTPEFFEPNSKGPYCFMASDTFAGLKTAGQLETGIYGGQPSYPFDTIDALGYQARRNSGTGEVQVTGKIPDHAMEKKRHFSSRTYRRGVRV